MEITPTGTLKTWLEERGYAGLLDVPSHVDDAEYQRLREECGKLHPGYDDEKRNAWAAYSILTRNSVSKEEAQELGMTDTSAIGKLARSADTQAVTFKKLVEGLENLEGGITSELRSHSALMQSSLSGLRGDSEAIASGIQREGKELRGLLGSSIQSLDAQFRKGQELAATHDANQRIRFGQIQAAIIAQTQEHATHARVREELADKILYSIDSGASRNAAVGEHVLETVNAVGDEVQTLLKGYAKKAAIGFLVWGGITLLLLSLLAVKAYSQVPTGPHVEILDEGTRVKYWAAGVAKLDFAGAGVSCAFASGKVTCTIAGGGGTHALLSATHSDTTAGTVARGDLITGQGGTPTWTRLAKGSASTCLRMDGTGTDVIWDTCPGAGGGDSITVATVAATDPDFIDSSRIDVTLATVPTPDTITWDIVADSITATYVDETGEFNFSNVANDYAGATYTGPTADPADSGIFRGSNAEALLCAEAAPAGTDVCLTVDASEIIQVSGGTLDAADLSGTVPDASINGANEAEEIDIDNLAGLTAIGSALTATNATNSFTGATFIGPTADPADSGIFRASNAEKALCWEASAAGTDVCLEVDASEIIQITGGTLDAADLSGTVPDASVDGSAEAGEIDIDNLAGITAAGSAYTFTNATNSFTAATFIGPTADPADSGVLRGSNAEKLVCWEASAAGTDVCLEVDASEIIQVTGGTFDAADLSGTVPDASVDGANEAGEIDIDNLAGLATAASAYGFSNATNTFLGATFTGPTADPADSGVFRVSNAETMICAEAAPAGTDVCFTVDASEVIQVSGGTLDAADLSGTVPDASVSGANEADEIDIDNLAGLTAIGSALTITNATNTFIGAVYQGPTADSADAGIIRLANAETIAWEAAPAGTDLTLTVSANERLTFSGLDCSAGDQYVTVNISGEFVCGTDDGGGSVAWSALTAPTGAVTMDSDGVTELFHNNFSAAYGATDVLFQIEQLTGNVTAGSILLELRAADADILLLKAWDGTNGIQLTKAGALSVVAAGSITATLGDSATAFFSAGAIEANYGGTGDDTSGSTGVPRIATGNWTYDAGSADLTASRNTTFTSSAADPADARFIRMGNNEGFAWELATPGTDKYLIVNTSDQLETNADIVGGSSTTNGSLTLGGASSTTASFATLYGGDAASNAEAPYIRLIPSPVGSGDDSYLYPGGVGACLSVSSTAPAADSTNCLVDMTTARTLTSKTIAGLGSGTTHGTANFISINRHATDCTAITDGVDGEACWEKDADTIYVCEPTAGGCDTAGEWIRVTASGAGGDSITVATVAATDPDIIDSSRIDFTLDTGATPDTIAADIVANSVNATYIDETTAYAWSSTTNTFVGASYTDGSGNPADGGVLRVGNNVSALCAEIATPGTDKCISLNTSDAWAFSGTGDFILTATDTNGGIQLIPNGTGDFILGAGAAFTMTFNAGATDPTFVFDSASFTATATSINLTGNIGIADGAATATRSMNVTRTKTDPSATEYGVVHALLLNETVGAEANPMFGAVYNVGIGATNSQNFTDASDGLTALKAVTDTATGATGTITNMTGVSAGGTIAAGTVTNRYGLHVLDTTGAGTVTNNYGLYVNDLADGATLNTAIYVAGADLTSLGGVLELRGAAGAGPTVEGNINFDTTSHTLEYGENGTNRTVANLDGAQTLTNKTLLQTSYVWIDAAACVAGTAVTNWDMPDGAGDAQPTAACNDTGSIQRPTLSFSGSAVNGVERSFRLPTGWSGNIDLVIMHLDTAASPTGNVEWEIQTVCRASGETWDASFNAAQTITDAAAAQNTLNDATQTALTTTGCAADEIFTIRIWRDGTNDTNNDAALMLGARLILRYNQTT